MRNPGDCYILPYRFTGEIRDNFSYRAAESLRPGVPSTSTNLGVNEILKTQLEIKACHGHLSRRETMLIDTSDPLFNSESIVPLT